MSVSTHIDPARKVATSVACGTLTYDDLRQARREMREHPDFQSSFDRIWDISEVTRVEVDDAVLGAIVAASLSEDNVFRAFVCRSTAPMTHLLNFIAEARRNHRSVAVFPTLVDAERWIEDQHNDASP